MSEYWIREDGDVDFADGDIGDRNHEGIVIEKLQRDIVDACERRFDLHNSRGRSFSDDEYVDWDQFVQALSQAYGEELAAKNPKYQEILENDPDQFVPGALKQAGVKKAVWDGARGGTDARTYAMQYWGWKTYRNENIDTWRITRSDLQAIIRGIDNISEEEGMSDEELARITFTINVFSTNRSMSLTLAQMEKWLERPQAVPPIQNPQFDWGSQQATKQVRDIDLQNMNHAYKRPGVNPFGDWVYNPMKTFRDWLQLKETEDTGMELNDNPYGHDYTARDIKKFGHGKSHPSLVSTAGGAIYPSVGDDFVLVEPEGTQQRGTVTHSAGLGGLDKFGKIRIALEDGQTMEMDFNREYKLGHISLLHPPQSRNEPHGKRTFFVHFS